MKGTDMNKDRVVNGKYYVQKKYKISFDGINADIQISKGMEKFIKNKIQEVQGKDEIEIHSFKAFVPYVDLKYIVEKFNLRKAEKFFVISSEEVFKKNDDLQRKRRKKNREFLEDKVKYFPYQDIDGRQRKERQLPEDFNIIAFKYNAATKDTEEESFFNLHSKIYLINDRYAFIGSANLTENALKNNYETLFFVNRDVTDRNKEFIDELIDFFDKLKEEKEIACEEVFFEETDDSWEVEREELIDKIKSYEKLLETQKKRRIFFNFFRK